MSYLLNLDLTLVKERISHACELCSSSALFNPLSADPTKWPNTHLSNRREIADELSECV